jgi:hypothetical protein
VLDDDTGDTADGRGGTGRRNADTSGHTRRAWLSSLAVATTTLSGCLDSFGGSNEGTATTATAATTAPDTTVTNTANATTTPTEEPTETEQATTTAMPTLPAVALSVAPRPDPLLRSLQEFNKVDLERPPEVVFGVARLDVLRRDRPFLSGTLQSRHDEMQATLAAEYGLELDTVDARFGVGVTRPESDPGADVAVYYLTGTFDTGTVETAIKEATSGSVSVRDRVAGFEVYRNVRLREGGREIPRLAVTDGLLIEGRGPGRSARPEPVGVALSAVKTPSERLVTLDDGSGTVPALAGEIARTAVDAGREAWAVAGRWGTLGRLPMGRESFPGQVGWLAATTPSAQRTRLRLRLWFVDERAARTAASNAETWAATSKGLGPFSPSADRAGRRVTLTGRTSTAKLTGAVQPGLGL